ncbi:MAG: nucleotidyl transferase AbiEii/AbiGii toxin family protein [Bacteroidetes bacterium]|nr:nucleotidyl transferase AbiEii/AbiGii toxin family protein [Bacteroidota bacterium]
MIAEVSLSQEWITAKQKKYGRDPSIIESMIHALYLLERLQESGLNFIFKGGTSLVLLLEQAARFSVDIDIIVKPDLSREDLETYLNKIVQTSNGFFTEVKLDGRRSYKGAVPKAHYIFKYKSNFAGKGKDGQVAANAEREILLDVLFAENPYPNLISKPIKTEWIELKSEPLIVNMPCVNSITGDKLTAFAPNTTGVPYFRTSTNAEGVTRESEMFREIMKQLFDVGCLFDVITDITAFQKSYEATVAGEIKYRPERGIKSGEEALKDTIATALVIARRDKQVNDGDKKIFDYLSKGVGQFAHFVYTSPFRIEHAQVSSAKAAYLATIALTRYTGEIARFKENIPLTDFLIAHPEYNFLNKQLKAVNKGEALFYWYQAIKLLYPESKEPVMIMTGTPTIERRGLSLKANIPTDIFVKGGFTYYETRFHIRFAASAFGKRLTAALRDANGQGIKQEIELVNDGTVSFEFNTEMDLGPNFGFLELISKEDINLEIWSEISDSRFI